MYDVKKFSYGYEIEWGDIDRTLDIPEHLGSWEYAETDIVNVLDPYKYIACDPLGISPPVGGEINTKPTKTWEEQVYRVMDVHDLFTSHNNVPTSSCVNHGHLHVHIPGLREDVASLKRLISYIQINQHDVIKYCYQFKYDEEMKNCKDAVMYLKLDGGRPMPDYMCDNIIKLATDFNSFIKLHAAGKDGISMGRPFRYAINTYCMKHTETIEFRCFRSTTELHELSSQFEFVEQFMYAALNTGKPVLDILNDYYFEFPKFIWNKDEYIGWKRTKWGKERGEKHRQYYDAT